MKYWLVLVAGLCGTGAGAQITSVSDPDALTKDPVPSERKQTQPFAQSQQVAVAPKNPVDATDPSPVAVDSSASSIASLDLTCGGGGSANKVAVANAYGWNRWGTSQVTAFGSRSQGFADQVDVRLFSGDDRIRLPRTMLPPIHGGSDGWFKLKNVKVTERAITASAAINFMNNPKVHIDRVTGTISINGRAGSYTGQCEAIDVNAPRKF